MISKNSESEQQDVLMKIQASKNGSDPSLLWSVDKKTVMETVYKEVRCEGSIELTADFYLYQHLLKISV